MSADNNIKVIFLDVDGVLNSEYDLMIHREKNNITGSILYAEVEDRPLKLLKELVDKTDAKIVVSSSWRIGCERSGRQSVFGADLYKKLEKRLRDYDLDIYDITPVCKGQRGDEIREWLNAHKNVDKFVIFDDDSDMREYTETNLVKTDYSNGLQEKHIEIAVKMLSE